MRTSKPRFHFKQRIPYLNDKLPHASQGLDVDRNSRGCRPRRPHRLGQSLRHAFSALFRRRRGSGNGSTTSLDVGISLSRYGLPHLQVNEQAQLSVIVAFFKEVSREGRVCAPQRQDTNKCLESRDCFAILSDEPHRVSV